LRTGKGVRKIRKYANWEWANVDAALDAEVIRREAEIRFEAREQLLQAEFIKNRKAEAKAAAEAELSALIRSMPVDDIDMLF
jgi:hypothetical protein